MNPSVSAPTSSAHSINSTPASSKPHVTAPQDARLPQSRASILQELHGQVPEVEVGWFLENVLPSLPPGADILATHEGLKQQNKITAQDYWSMWPTYPLSAVGAKENALFQPFEELATAICAESKLDDPALARFICIPDTSLETSTRANTSRPDCAAIRIDAKCLKNGGKRNKMKWTDIAVPSEFKVNGTNEKDVVDVGYHARSR